MKKILPLALLLLLMLPAHALCEQARDITKTCVIKDNATGAKLSHLTDNLYKTHYLANNTARGFIRVTAPKGERIGALYIRFYDQPVPLEIKRQNEAGEWVVLQQVTQPLYYNHFIALKEPCDSIRIMSGGKQKQRMDIAELAVFTPGEPPKNVQRWQMPPEKADLLLLIAHPDDEVVFMGGILPTYAGQRQKATVVAVLVGTTSNRKSELLDSLWTQGVRYYPVIGPLNDVHRDSLKEMYRYWSKDSVYAFVSDLFRKYRPEVVVTHDARGEYGHGAHRVAADAAITAFTAAAEEARGGLPPWQVKKLYLHLYRDNARVMNWDTPLPRFDGRTALEVSKQAFAFHRSQQKTGYCVYDKGAYNCRLYGLRLSAVGRDVACDDFFENIP